MAAVETTVLSPVLAACPTSQRVLVLGDNEPRTARVFPRYRRHRKPRHERQTDDENYRVSATSCLPQTSTTGTVDDEHMPQETKPLLIVDVANTSDASGDCPSTPGVVDRSCKFNGTPANVVVSVEEAAAAAARSTTAWTKWRKLHSGLSLKRRVTERLASIEWWRRRRRRRSGGDVAESTTALPHKQNTFDHKSFPDVDFLTVIVLRRSVLG